MLKPVKVATPATALTVLVPDRVPLPGFDPKATVTLPVNPGSVFPPGSVALTAMAGVIPAAAATHQFDLKLAFVQRGLGFLSEQLELMVQAIEDRCHV